MSIAVIKCGGSILDNLTDQFFGNIAKMQEKGIRPIVVHGGGSAIQDMLDKLNVTCSFVDGLRTTSADAMNVVEMVLSGYVNNALTRQINDNNIQAAGFSGSDAQLIQAEPINFERYGYVGDVTAVNTLFLQRMLDSGVVPVIAPIATGGDGSRYNVNADTAAGAIARDMNADRLIFMTDVPGIMQEEEVISNVSQTEIDHMIADGVIFGGMIPKVKAAAGSLGEGLSNVMIADAHQRISMSGFTGTIITK
ncbi:acetylglutamate kinase [Lentibacillus halophilus]|uniref:Acetylglutamate kinase n=1 Tax=Lentibacillus halophilus TaxID=295065 RepID=A0ABP3IUM3_9BACI